ncbi:MAG: hypothetical protein ACO3RB_08745 [Ilumatobacteraceae bacterium]
MTQADNGHLEVTASGRPRHHVLAEHEALSKLEQSSTEMRHQTFTALMSISFVLAGFAFRGPESDPDTASRIAIPGFGEFWPNQIAAVLGLVFYAFTVLHYWWYHRYSHIYRHQLKELERDLGIQVYSHRRRPTKDIGSRTLKFHFDWSLYIIGGLYTAAVGQFSGWRIVGGTAALALCLYGILLVLSIKDDEEPRETKAAMSRVV